MIDQFSLDRYLLFRCVFTSSSRLGRPARGGRRARESARRAEAGDREADGRACRLSGARVSEEQDLQQEEEAVNETERESGTITRRKKTRMERVAMDG